MDFKEQLFNLFNHQIVGGSVVLIKNGMFFQYNYGCRSLINNRPVEDDTIFRIASISKVIIGMTVMKLTEDGLLDLDEDIGNYLGFRVRNPKYPDVPITPRMLLMHTSSITNGLDNESVEIGYNGVNGKKFFVALEDLLLNTQSGYYTEKTYSPFCPGEKYIYSNFGFGIIACIIEKVTNTLFTDFVEQKILKPLKLDASFKADRIRKQDKISDTFLGFTTNRTANSFIEATYPDFPLGNNFRGPAGGLFISMPDLSKIMVALFNDGKYRDVQLLKKETVDYYLSMNFLPSRTYPDKGVLLQGHTGNAYGVTSLMYFCKAKKTGICFIANGGNYRPMPSGMNQIQEGIIDLLLQAL
ncbi:MAG: serine hydrolase [Acholeplasmataceae bacterium]|nr:serine hydrolase [Acholeplasmataceae bacterium]